MAATTVTLSSKGQLVLPKAVRQQQRWGAGTRITVEQTKDGVMLKAAPLFPPTTLDQVAGCLAYKGPAKTIEEMDAAVFAEAVRQNPRPKRKS
jgi:AbrB family looped-hinge helix DNA binding protein